MTPDELTDEQIETIQQLAVVANEKMDSGSLGNATQALNLGCTITFIPGFIPSDLDLINWYIFRLRAVRFHRYGKPFFTMRSFYLVAVSPTSFIILHIVVKNKEVGF